MPSTYTVNLGIEKPATGEQSGTWGDTTNVNFDILDQAINGAERVTLTSAGSSGSPNTLQISNGATSDGRNKWIEFYSSGDLGGSVYVQLDPNDAEKIVFVRNSLASSRSILLFQGTYNSGRDLEIPAGVDMVVKFDGGGASAATVTDVFTKLRATEITTPTLTATTADINGGTIDNSVIGGSTAAAVTGTAVVANTSLNIAGDGATVTGIKDEDNMASNSATKLATQQSIKAYVDSQVGTVDTWAEVLANGATSGSTNPEVTAGQALKTNTINETSAGSGVTIDSVLLKDDVVNATDVETSSISANDGTASATIANSTGNFTITNFISNSVDIGGGAIDGTVIGGSVVAAGSFTSLTSTSSNIIAGTGTDAIQTMRIGSGSGGANKASINFQNSASSELFSLDFDNSTGTLDIRSDISGNIAQFGRSGGIVFNQDSNDYDFRVESNGNANMLFVDGGNDHVNIGTTSDFGDTFNVSGTAHFTNNVTLSRQTNDSGSTGLILEKTRSTSVNGNTVVQDGDQLGYVTFRGNDGDQFLDGAYVISFVDGTPGNNDMPASLQFWTTADGASSPTKRFSIANDGYGEYEAARNDIIRFTGANSGSITFRNDTANQFVMHTGSSDDFVIGTGGNNDRLTITSAGDATFDGAINLSGNLTFTAADGREIIAKESIVVTIDSDDNDTGRVFGVRSGASGSYESLMNLSEASGAVFNEDSMAALDFRVESDSYTHMFFVDAGNNRASVGASTAPYHTFEVWGPNAANGEAKSTMLIMDTTSGTTGTGGGLALGGYYNGTSDIIYHFGNIQGIKENSTAGNYAGAMLFSTRQNGGTPLEKMRITSDGAVVLQPDGITTGLRLQGRASDNNFFIQWNDHGGSTNYGSIGSVSSVPGLTYNADDHEFFNQATNSSFLKMNSSGAVFNENSADRDFRVESDAESHAIFVDAGNDRIGLFSSSPTAGYKVSFGGGGFNVLDDNAFNRITSTEGYTVSTGGTGNIFRLATMSAHGARARARAIGTIGYGDPNVHEYIIEMSIGNQNNEFGVNVYRTGDPLNQNTFKQTNAEFDVYTDKVNDASFDVWVKLGHFTRLEFFLEAESGTTARFDNSGTATLPGTAVDTNTKSEYNMFAEDVRVNTQGSNGTSIAQNVNFNISGAVFNESSNDMDFRVESDGVSNMLHVDGGANGVGIRVNGDGNQSLKIKSTGATGNMTLIEDEGVGDGSYTPYYQYKVAYIAGNSSNTQLTIPFNARSYNQTGYLKIRVLPALHNLTTPANVATAEFALGLAYQTTISVHAVLSSSGNYASATGNSSNQLIITFSNAYSNATMSGAFVHIEFFGQQGTQGAPDWNNIAFN